MCIDNKYLYAVIEKKGNNHLRYIENVFFIPENLVLNLHACAVLLEL